MIFCCIFGIYKIWVHYLEASNNRNKDIAINNYCILHFYKQ